MEAEIDMYKKPPANIDEFFAPFSQEINDLGREIREKIKSAIPESEENIYGGKKIANVLYSLNGTENVICGIQPKEKFIRVFFHNWQRLKEAGYSIQGSGKNTRHIKIENQSDLNGVDLIKMIKIVKQ